MKIDFIFKKKIVINLELHMKVKKANTNIS